MRESRPRQKGKHPSLKKARKKPAVRPVSRSRSKGAGTALLQPGHAPVVSVIVPVMNERRTIAGVLKQARLVHPHTELLVVANGSTDGSAQIAARMGARVIHCAHALGHDVGRSVGARAARGNVLLFLDGDIIIPAARLRPFIDAILSGKVDIALNDYSGPVSVSQVHPVVLAKHALNTMLGRDDLLGTSLTAIPNAMSRAAAERVGIETLAVPPLAQAKAIVSGMVVSRVAYVNVGSTNRPRRERERRNPLHRLITGDHLEAAYWLGEQGLAAAWRGTPSNSGPLVQNGELAVVSGYAEANAHAQTAGLEEQESLDSDEMEELDELSELEQLEELSELVELGELEELSELEEPGESEESDELDAPKVLAEPEPGPAEQAEKDE